jgi:ubiquinone/menaquinone biosynthesis C-methylase UbiE
MTGIDITSKAVELAKKRLQLLGLNAEIFEADAENLPFKDNYFDFITSYGVLHHTPNTQKSIDEVYRVLKPGGKAIISLYYKNICHNRYAFPFLIRFLNLIGAKMHGVEELKQASVQEFVNWYDGKENPLGKIYTKRGIKEMFSKFSNVTVEVHWFPKRFISLGSKIPKRLLRFFDKRIGFLIFIKGYKR